MKKKQLNIFLSVLTLLALFFLTKELRNNEFEINVLSIFVLIFMISSEILGNSNSKHKYMTLGGPAMVFSLLYIPLINTYVIIGLLYLFSRSYDKYVMKEGSVVFNNKLLFNITCFIICAGITSQFIDMTLNENIMYNIIAKITIMAVIYNTINFVLLAVVVYLYTGQKSYAMNDFFKTFFSHFYFVMIAILLVFGYEAYGIFGLAFIYLFLAPIQGYIMNFVLLAEIKRALTYDILTGAYNRYYFEKILGDKINDKIDFTVIFADLNSFKHINDTYGHLVGDEVLKHFVYMLKRELNLEDKIFRYGGDEFCIIIDNPVEDKIIEGKIDRLETKFKYQEETINYSIAFGTYDYKSKLKLNQYEVIDIVDKIMYEEKAKYKKLNKIN